MRSAEEIKDWYYGNHTNISVSELIKSIQIEAYNQAIDDAVKNVKCISAGYCIGTKYDYKPTTGVDKESILKLKKK